VEEDPLAVAGISDGYDVGPPVRVEDRDVGDPAGVENRVKNSPVLDLLLGQPADPGALGRGTQSRAQASVSTERRICSISSKCDWSQISGGESWITGSPRSSARQ
jgi:hypothetical protein